MRHLLAALPLAALALAGCSGDGVRTFTIDIGWNDDGTQYMHPGEIRVHQGDKVRFAITNHDDPNRDYNGPAKPTNDNFHDVALLDYDGDGDGVKETIEHEVPAGQTETTHYKGKDHFTASERGTFRIICEVRTSPTHDALGMHAVFIVE
jgi:plastocyanin